MLMTTRVLLAGAIAVRALSVLFSTLPVHLQQ
ncbi:hypothetical protein APA386B_2344 [Acetobacter pasteurianus 386B]|nr:hypothetical protein APA386B_2344 [Acetobacter pasteurianus 386B]